MKQYNKQTKIQEEALLKRYTNELPLTVMGKFMKKGKI